MKKLISEDNTIYNVARQQSGNTARIDSKGETAPQLNQVKAFLDANKNSNNDNSKAPKLLPYPLHMKDEVISDLYVAACSLRKILANTCNNPAIGDKNTPRRKDNLHHIAYAAKRLELIDKAIVDISIELDKIK